MNSIRRRLTIRLLCMLGLTTTAVGLVLFLGVRFALTRQFDSTLASRLASLESATRWDGHRVDLDFVADAMPWYRPGPEAEYFSVCVLDEADGLPHVVATSPSLGQTALAFATGMSEVVADARLPDGRSGRMATRILKPSPEEDLDLPGKELERQRAIDSSPQVQVTVAMGRQRLDSILTTFGVSLLLAAGGMGFGLIIATRHALIAGLAPLETFSQALADIRPEALTNRISDENIVKELRPVRARLNDLIDRLDVAFQRERQFASAAAHELRTPVAELRSVLEVAASRPRGANETREAMGEALDITLRMSRLIGALLSLARTTACVEAAPLESVQIKPLIIQVARRHQQNAVSRGGSLRVSDGDIDRVQADPAALDSILTNVIANAIEYADPAPLVECRARRGSENTAWIEISNPTATLTSDDVKHFFEPFWRMSRSRADHEHVGLGLAVSRSLARNMGGDLSASVERGVICVRIVLKSR